MDWTRLLASRSFFLVALVGLVITGISVLGVPQGSSDAEVVSSYPLSMGPFIVLFGLHHAGRSLALWAVLVALWLHAGALVVVRRARSRDAPERFPGPSRMSLAVSAALVFATVAGLVWTGGMDRPSRSADPSRLRVQVSDAPEGPASQTVEEGALYEVPRADGPRTLLFGVASRGPYALERTHGGHLRVHLPGFSDESRPSVVAVEARRPAALGSPDSGLVPNMPRWLGLACLVVVAGALLVLAGRGAALAETEWRQVSWLSAAFLALLVFNPLVGPGRARTPLWAASGGGDVAWSAVVTTPGDVAPWLSLLPADIRLDGVWWLNLIAATAAVLMAAAVLSSRETKRFPRTPVQALAGVCAGLTALSGLAWIAYSVGRIPAAASVSDLLGVFESEVLPRIPMEVTVLDVGVTSPGPYHVPVAVGLAAAATALAAALVFARVARGRSGRTGPSPSAVRAAWQGVLVVAVLRAAWLAASGATDGALPFALLAVLVAAMVPLVARGHPDWPAGGLATAMAAAAMQFAMPM